MSQMNPEQAMMAGMMGAMGGQPEQPMPGTDTPEAMAGRGGDTTVAHLTPGEIVLPLKLANDPQVRDVIEKAFARYNTPMSQFTVGNEDNNVNPETGYPEFDDFADDVLGFDPGGGGIYDVPILGDVAEVVVPGPPAAARAREEAGEIAAQAERDIQATIDESNARLEQGRLEFEAAARLSKKQADAKMLISQAKFKQQTSAIAKEQSGVATGSSEAAADTEGRVRKQIKTGKRRAKKRTLIQQQRPL